MPRQSQISEYVRLLQKENEELRNKVEELSAIRQEQEDQIRETQARAFQQLDRAEWTSPPDENIRRELDGLEKKIKQWAKSSAVSQLKGWPVDSGQHLHVSLRPLLPEGSGIDKAWDELKSKPWLLLSAWLTSFIYSEVFSQPFGFAGELYLPFGGRPTKAPFLGKYLASIFQHFQDMYSSESKQVQAWRSQFYRLLDPLSESHPEAKEMVETARVRHCQSIAREFRCLSARLWKNERTNTMKEQLEDIMKLACGIAYRLQTQNSFLACHNAVGSLGHNNKEFHRDIEFMEPSNLHSGVLDDDPAALNGQDILLVLHPLVVMHGDSEGMDYKNRVRILKKTVVWMGNLS